MDARTTDSIKRVIETIHHNIGEKITIDDMARTAMFSKFHFTRLFQRATGVSPGRFLSAVRLQEAKRLLLTTELSVTEISHRVGYTSVGTFSSRFKSSVGLSPSAYRELTGYAPHITDAPPAKGRSANVVHGEIVPPPSDDETGPVFLGLFPDTIPQGNPVRCAVLPRPGRFKLENVPDGCWYLLAQSVRPGYEEVLGDLPPIVGAHGPITMHGEPVVRLVEVRLRPMQTLDPPVLLALLDARRTALHAAAG